MVASGLACSYATLAVSCGASHATNTLTVMNPFTTHGAISWSELLSANKGQALDFYANLLGWEHMEMPMPNAEMYHVMMSGGVNAAGLMARPSPDIPPCWGFYVTVKDVRSLAATAGLNLVIPVMDTTVGPFCSFVDPQGAFLSAIQYKDTQGEGGVADSLSAFRTHGLFSWFELRTSDPEAAAAFYSKLFGWSFVKNATPFGIYREIKVGDDSIGGISALPGADVPPHWGGYITVDDVDAAEKAARSLGATITAPAFDVPHVGRMTYLLDPEGASIALITYAPMES